MGSLIGRSDHNTSSIQDRQFRYTMPAPASNASEHTEPEKEWLCRNTVVGFCDRPLTLPRDRPRQFSSSELTACAYDSIVLISLSEGQRLRRRHPREGLTVRARAFERWCSNEG